MPRLKSYAASSCPKCREFSSGLPAAGISHYDRLIAQQLLRFVHESTG